MLFPTPDSSTDWFHEPCSTSHKSICVTSRLMARRFCPYRLHATLLWHEASWALREGSGGHLSVVVCQQIAGDWWSLALVNKIYFEIIADPYTDRALPLNRGCPSPSISKHLYVLCWRCGVSYLLQGDEILQTELNISGNPLYVMLIDHCSKIQCTHTTRHC